MKRERVKIKSSNITYVILLHPEVSIQLCNLIQKNYSTKNENIPLISDHVPTHKKPVSDEEFYSYLAGLIEGDGSFSKHGHTVKITFHINDAPLAYYIKKRIGYGIIREIKGKNAIEYFANKPGTIKIAKLINGKLRTDKIDSFNNNILNHINKNLDTPLAIQEKDTSCLTRGYWLAGFTDADGSFQIKTIIRKDRKQGYEIRLKLQFDQKTKFILDQFKEEFAGHIGYRKTQDTYYFGTTSFSSAKKVINYFDHYHLLSSKHVNYLKWRKVYRIIQSREHLTKKGIEKILKIKLSMNSYSKESFVL